MPYGTSLGTSHEDEISYVLDNGLTAKQKADQQEMKSNETSGDFQSRFYATDASTMPLGASTELAGALKAKAGTQVPDYDYDAWKKANPNVEMAPGQHYPDTFKLPNHMTFSDESMYHGQNGNQGGHWGTDDQGRDTFTPGPTNLQQHSMSELRDYFKRVEPNGVLLPPADSGSNISLLKAGKVLNSAIDSTVGAVSRLPETLMNAPESIASSVLDAVTLPGDALAGKVDPMSEEGVGRATRLSMLMVGGPSLLTGKTDATLGSSAIKGPYKNYIDMFLKQPMPENVAKSYETAATKPLPKSGDYGDDVDKALKEIQKHLDQQPLLDTSSALDHPYTKDQLHPDNFYQISQNKLSTGQAKDLHDTFAAFKQGAITKTEYLNEMAEYEKYSVAGGYKGKTVPITESSDHYAAKWNEMHGDDTGKSEPLTHGDKVLHDLLDDYPDLLNSAKASPKEKFIDALDNIHNRLSTTFANIRDKYIKTVKGFQLELNAPVNPEAAAKGYTQPAYRGLKVYPDKQTNPVFNFGEAEEGKMYSTASPMLADMYSEYLSSHPGYKVPPGTFKDGAQVMPLYINTKDYHYYDAKGGHWTNENSKAIEQALNAKKKGVIVDNVRDEPNSTTSLPPKKIFITFPSGAGTVKSRFAKNFDPSSPNILHGIGSAAAIGTAAGYLTDEANRE